MHYRVEDAADGTVTLRAGHADGERRVTFAPFRGGLVTQFSAGNIEYLALDEATFRDPSANVRGGIPVLFPFPGRLTGDRYLARGAAYALGQHGFARKRAFTEVARRSDGAAAITVVLEDDAETRAVYPYRFRLTLEVALTDRLMLTTTVENRDTVPLPWALGFHPYFAIPNAEKGALSVAHEAERAWDNVGRRIVAADPLQFTPTTETDLHLLDDRSATKVLCRGGGALPWLELTVSDERPVWVFWSVPGKDFVCAEPWTAPGNALQTGDRVPLLAPGAQARHTFTLLPR
jgi:galactose mutarotase-like enzyme